MAFLVRCPCEFGAPKRVEILPAAVLCRRCNWSMWWFVEGHGIAIRLEDAVIRFYGDTAGDTLARAA